MSMDGQVGQDVPGGKERDWAVEFGVATCDCSKENNMDSLRRRARSQSHSVNHGTLGKNIFDTWLKITEHNYMSEIQYMFIASVKC